MPHHDLVVVGAGSGNMIVDERFDGLDVAYVEATHFGGTCLNVGCIPTKMLAYTAEVAETIRSASTFGVDASIDRVRWSDIRDRVFAKLDPIAEEGRKGREESGTVYLGTASFTGPRAMRVDCADGSTAEFTADRIVLAAGGRPVVPPPVTENGAPYRTSDTIMRIDELPRSLAIIGGGYIAAEFAHVFGGLGVEVTMVEADDTLLGGMDETVCEHFTEVMRERFDVRIGRTAEEVTGDDAGVRLVLDDGSVVEAEMLLVAAGRKPNGDRMNLEAGGVDTHDDGRIVVDGYGRTSAEGVWALGDISTDHPLKHVANHEATVVAHNLTTDGELREVDNALVPAAVFASPQVGTVGLTEQQCRDQNLGYAVSVQPYSDVAYGWAMEDQSGFCKIIAETGTGRLLGAHLMGPQASSMVQQLVQAIALELTAEHLADLQYWIHPALTEVIENALRGLDV